jgi:hypothetical protein
MKRIHRLGQLGFTEKLAFEGQSVIFAGHPGIAEVGKIRITRVSR